MGATRPPRRRAGRPSPGSSCSPPSRQLALVLSGDVVGVDPRRGRPLRRSSRPGAGIALGASGRAAAQALDPGLAFGRAQLLVFHEVAAGRAERLPALVPDIVYLAIAAVRRARRGAAPGAAGARTATRPRRPGPDRDAGIDTDGAGRAAAGPPRALARRRRPARSASGCSPPTARVTAERGYEATTVADILADAGVGRESFYELFDDRRDCVLAAHQTLLDDLIEQVAAAYAGPGEWVERCRATLAALLDWFAADPPAGRFLMVEVAAVGPEFHERFEAGFDRFVAVDRLRPRPATSPIRARCRRPTSPSAPRSPASTSRSPPAAPRTCPACCPSSPTRSWSRSSAKTPPAKRRSRGAVGRCVRGLADVGA